MRWVSEFTQFIALYSQPYKYKCGYNGGLFKCIGGAVPINLYLKFNKPLFFSNLRTASHRMQNAGRALGTRMLAPWVLYQCHLNLCNVCVPWRRPPGSW